MLTRAFWADRILGFAGSARRPILLSHLARGRKNSDNLDDGSGCLGVLDDVVKMLGDFGKTLKNLDIGYF